MCGNNNEGCCCHPEIKKNYPRGCTPEQIQECHGDHEDHPCEDDEQ